MWLIQEELGEIEEQLKMEIKDKITDFTEKLMAENEELKNKLEVS